jgi:hypothetical protein
VGTAATCFVGIDVSKATLDVCLLTPDGRAREAAFGNDARGHAALVAWAGRRRGGRALHFCLEATGPYSEAPALALVDAGHLVSVVNPTRVKYAGLARGRGNKTDKADARLIAESCYPHARRRGRRPARSGPRIRAGGRPGAAGVGVEHHLAAAGGGRGGAHAAPRSAVNATALVTPSHVRPAAIGHATRPRSAPAPRSTLALAAPRRPANPPAGRRRRAPAR